MSKERISKLLELSDSFLKDYPGTWTFIQKKTDNIHQQRGQCEKHKSRLNRSVGGGGFT